MEREEVLKQHKKIGKAVIIFGLISLFAVGSIGLLMIIVSLLLEKSILFGCVLLILPTPILVYGILLFKGKFVGKAINNMEEFKKHKKLFEEGKITKKEFKERTNKLFK